MFFTILIFIVILGLLVFVHEFGHFITAKKNGVRVEEFGFGFPPRLFGFKWGETVYSINLIPLGGFVKAFGEDGADKDNPRSFASKKAWQRAMILVAGIAMNFLLAAVLLGITHMIGLPTAVSEENVNSAKDLKVQITDVVAGAPAAGAGIQIGDTIRSVNSEPILRAEQFQKTIKENLGKEIKVEIGRGKETLQVGVIPRENPPEGQGAIGIGLVETTIVKYPWYQAFWEGLKSAYYFTGMFLVALGGLVKGLVVTGHVSGDIAGPVGIAVLTNQVTKLGFVYLLNFTALLSLNLAIINAFPFPALDGGRLLFVIIEKIKGSPVSQKVEQMVHTVGFALLIMLMIVITVRDIGRFL